MNVTINFHFDLDTDTDIATITEEVADNIFLVFKCDNILDEYYRICRIIGNERLQQRECKLFSPEEPVYIECSGGYDENGSFCSSIEAYYNEYDKYPHTVIW